MSALVLPIFPLPELTFFPHTLLPLHVFEARYRAMVTDTLSRKGRLAVPGLKPGYEASYAGKPPVYDVAGVGEIVKWERLPTGRYNIVLRGEARARIERELPTDTLYRVVAARALEETPPRHDVGREIRHVRALCRRLLTALGRSPGLVDEAVDERQPPGPVIDQIASAVLPDATVRQELLEALDVETRLRRLIAALEQLVQEVTGGRDIEDR